MPIKTLVFVIGVEGVPLDIPFLNFRRIPCSIFGLAFHRRFDQRNRTLIQCRPS